MFGTGRCADPGEGRAVTTVQSVAGGRCTTVASPVAFLARSAPEQSLTVVRNAVS